MAQAEAQQSLVGLRGIKRHYLLPPSLSITLEERVPGFGTQLFFLDDLFGPISPIEVK
jgi:hypothetical protein